MRLSTFYTKKSGGNFADKKQSPIEHQKKERNKHKNSTKFG